jgi:hypothetical protein
MECRTRAFSAGLTAHFQNGDCNDGSCVIAVSPILLDSMGKGLNFLIDRSKTLSPHPQFVFNSRKNKGQPARCWKDKVE